MSTRGKNFVLWELFYPSLEMTDNLNTLVLLQYKKIKKDKKVPGLSLHIHLT